MHSCKYANGTITVGLKVGPGPSKPERVFGMGSTPISGSIVVMVARKRRQVSDAFTGRIASTPNYNLIPPACGPARNTNAHK